MGLAAVLQQVHPEGFRTVAFASRSLSGAYLWGRPFTLRTDHQALVTLLGSGTATARPLRVSRWTERLLAYNFTVNYKKGPENVVADCLPRLPLPSALWTHPTARDSEAVVAQVTGCLTKKMVQQKTLEDVVLQRVKKQMREGWSPRQNVSGDVLPYWQLRSGLSVVDELIFRRERLVVRTELTSELITIAHESHPGIVRNKNRLRESYW